MDMSLFTSLEGRINRQKWWLGLIALMIIQWVFYIVITMIFGGGMMVDMEQQDPEAVARAMQTLLVPMLILVLVFLWPTLAIYVKRWHDRNKSGWWTLILLIPLIGPIWALVELGFLRGTEGSNNYGADPLAA